MGAHICYNTRECRIRLNFYLVHHLKADNRILNMDIMTFLDFNIDSLLITLKLFFLRIIIPNMAIISCKNIQKSTCIKWTYGLLGQDYRVALLSTLYITVSVIIILIYCA